MFGSILMASVRSTPTSLEQTRSRSCHQDKPAASLHWDGCACFYINRQALWQRVWLGGGPQIPLKVHSLLSRCLFEDRKSNKGGGRWRVVCCRFCTSFCLCRYHDAAKKKRKRKRRRWSYPVMWAGTRAQDVVWTKTTSPTWSSHCLLTRWKKEGYVAAFQCVLCFTVTQITSSTVSLTAPWSWLQAACRCLLQCCLPSAESV